MKAMILKEFRQMRRDRRTMALLFMVPLLMLTVFGYAARFDVKQIPTAVVGSPPPGVLQAPGTDILIDGTELFSAQSALRQVGAVLSARAEVLYNPGLNTAAVMIPGIIGFILLFVGLFITGLGVVREREQGTLEYGLTAWRDRAGLCWSGPASPPSAIARPAGSPEGSTASWRASWRCCRSPGCRAQSESGAAVLVSTHYMDEAEQADRVVIMAGGRVVAAGTVPEIIGGRSVVEVAADDWPAALAAVERHDRVVLLDGRVIRVLGDEVTAVRADLERAGISASSRLVPASLNETLVELSRDAPAGVAAGGPAPLA